MSSDSHHAAILTEMMEAAIIFDPTTTRILEVNPRACALYGFLREEFIGLDFRSLKGEIEFDTTAIREVVEKGSIRTFESIHHHRDGTPIAISLTASLIRFRGKPAILSIHADVTEERAAQERLRALREVAEESRAPGDLARSRAYFRALIEDTRDLITVLDPDGTIRLESPAIERVFGYKASDLIGARVFELIHPDDREQVERALAAVCGRGETRTVQFRFRDHQGNWRVVESVGHVSAAAQIVVSSRDVTERDREQTALRQSEQRLRLAQRTGRIDTWEIDLTASQGSSSEQTPAPSGYAALPSWTASLYPEDRDHVLAQLTAAIANRTPLELEFRVIWPDGQVRWLAARGEFVRHELGEADRFIGINVDFTDRRRIEEELERTRDAALEASRAKDQFLANISHEIRTPMNGILGLTGLLLDTSLTPEQRSDLETVRQSALHLLELINDILDLSRLEAGKLNIAAAPFDLRECVADVIDLVMPQASAKRLALRFEYRSGTPTRFVGSPGRIRQIVLNFIANAVKFTESGAVTVIVGSARDAEAPASVRIEVRDTGPGIAENVRGRLFQKFVQADAASTREHGGAGLGLAISKALAELMGGCVGLVSELGQGSTFWVELPLPIAEETVRRSPAATASAQQPIVPRLRGRVLVVEDNSVNQRVISRLLTRAGARVDLASNGREAVAMCCGLPYDLILMDCQMPVMDGFEAARAIRAAEDAGHRVPILAVTARVGADERARCLEAGMDDFVSKPYDAAELIELAGEWIDRNIASGQSLLALHRAVSETAARDPHRHNTV